MKRAGATSWVQGEEVLGASLLAWDTHDGTWRSLAANGDGAAAPDWLDVSDTDGALLRRLLLQDALHLMVTPVGTNGAGAATVATDYIEATLRYRLPR